MPSFRKVASVSEVPEGQGIAVEVGERRIALFNIDGQFLAVEATCVQHRAPLEKGVIVESRLHCPWHGVAFDLTRGVCSAFPAASSAATYEVKVDGADVLLAI